jgi:hypothetical protein
VSGLAAALSVDVVTQIKEEIALVRFWQNICEETGATES